MCGNVGAINSSRVADQGRAAAAMNSNEGSGYLFKDLIVEIRFTNPFLVGEVRTPRNQEGIDAS
jgi:hypothetical protein